MEPGSHTPPGGAINADLWGGEGGKKPTATTWSKMFGDYDVSELESDTSSDSYCGTIVAINSNKKSRTTKGMSATMLRSMKTLLLRRLRKNAGRRRYCTLQDDDPASSLSTIYSRFVRKRNLSRGVPKSTTDSKDSSASTSSLSPMAAGATTLSRLLSSAVKLHTNFDRKRGDQHTSQEGTNKGPAAVAGSFSYAIGGRDGF